MRLQECELALYRTLLRALEEKLLRGIWPNAPDMALAIGHSISVKHLPQLMSNGMSHDDALRHAFAAAAKSIDEQTSPLHFVDVQGKPP